MSNKNLFFLRLIYNFAVVKTRNNLLQTINITTMKKYFFIVAMFLSLMSLSCDKIPFLDCGNEEPVFVDWAPIKLGVMLCDTEGNNLLDPENPNCYDPSVIKIKYEGQEYSVLNPDSPQTSAYKAEFGKIFIAGSDGHQYLEIGEFNADEKCEMREIEIIWGDGTSDIIAYSNDYSINEKYANDADKNWGYKFYRKAYLNGEEYTTYDGKNRFIGFNIYKEVAAPEDIIIDWAPIFMRVYLRDAEGNNLLDATNEKCYDTSKIVVTYEGKEYNICNPYTPETSEYLAVFGEIWLMKDNNGEAYLEIGEWGVMEKYEMCSVEVVWGDGTSDTFAFSNDYTYDPAYCNNKDYNFGYTFIRSAYLNGVQLSDKEYQGSRLIIYNIVK